MKATLFLLLCSAAFGQTTPPVNIQTLTCNTDRIAIPVSIGNRIYCFTIDPSIQASPPTPTGGPGVLSLPTRFYIMDVPATGSLGPCGPAPPERLMTLAFVHGTATPGVPGTGDALFVALMGTGGACQWVMIAQGP